MSEMRSLEEALTATYDNLDRLSPRDVSAFWAVVPKFLGGKGPMRTNQQQQQMFHHFDKVSTKSIQDIDRYDPRDMSTLAISLAKIVDRVSKRKRPTKGSPHQILQDLIGESKQFIFREIASSSVPILHEFDARHLSNFIYAFGLVGEVVLVEDGSTFFDMLAKEVLSFDNLDEFLPQALSNISWAYANAGVSNSQLFEKLADHIVGLDNLNEFWPQALSNIVWAYATSDEQHPKLFKKVADHIISHDNLDEFWPQALSNIVWAYANVGESTSQMFKKVAEHMIALDSLDRYDSQALSNISWAFATAEESHPELFRKIADHIVGLDSLRQFNEQELSNTVWAYATSEVYHPNLFKKVADHIITLDKLKSFKPQALSNTLWAYATLDEQQNPKLFEKMANHIIELPNLNGFKSQALSNTVWAFATTGQSHPQLFNKLANEAIKRQREFTPQGVANFLWAYATNGQIDENLFLSLVPSVKDNLGKYTAQDLSNVAWAYSVSNVDAPSVFNNEFINACLKRKNDFILENLTQLHQWQLWQEDLKSDISLPSSLKKKCYETFISEDPSPSKLQDDVVSILSSIGLQPQEEVLIKNGYRIDAVVELNGQQVAVEVDGPSHFIGRELTGSTILKHRQVTNIDGIQVVSVPYWEWNQLKNHTKKKKQYLQYLLGI